MEKLPPHAVCRVEDEVWLMEVFLMGNLHISQILFCSTSHDRFDGEVDKSLQQPCRQEWHKVILHYVTFIIKPLTQMTVSKSLVNY